MFERASEPVRVLVIEHDQPLWELLADVLTDEGYRAVTTDTESDGLMLSDIAAPQLVLLDLELPDRTGASALATISIGTLIGATHKGACRGVCSEISHRVQDRTLSVLPHFLWSMVLTTQEPADGADRTPTDRSHCA